MTSPTPWVDVARADLGVKEIPGREHNPKVLSYFAEVGHPEITDDETAWCAAALGAWLRRAGYPIPPKKDILGARCFESYGKKLTAFKPGCICVFYRTKLREKDWRRHVGIGLKETKTHIEVLGGNQSNAVSIQKFPKKNLTAMRWPVAPTVKELREAGSTEIKTADLLEKAGPAVAVGVGGAASAITAQPQPNVITPDEVTQWTGSMKVITETLNAIGGLISQNPWLVLCIIMAVLCILYARQLKKARVERAKQGQFISTQVEE